MTVRVRVATSADIQNMHRVRMSVRENRLTNPERVQSFHYEALLDEDAGAWVAEVEDRIVGFAVGDLLRSNVWALFVEPAFEGQGIGRRLHATMMTWLFDAGAQLIWLNTDADTRAEAFYRSAGWRLVGDEGNGERRYEMSREDWLLLA